VSLDEVDNSQEEPVRREYGDDDLRLLGSVDRITLERAIAQLPPGYRAVFVLHDVEGYEHNEIAQIMNYSIGNSKSQLHKARLKLRDWLRQDRDSRRGGSGTNNDSLERERSQAATEEKK